MLLQDGRDDSNVDDNNNSCVATKLEHYKDTKWWQISSDDHSGNEDDSLADTPAFASWKDQKYFLALDLWETMM